MPDICLLGTGGMLPLKERWLTSCYIEHNGSAVLIDCGEGTQIALAEFDCKVSRIQYLLITHLHADHISGLPGLLLSMGNGSRTEPLEIYVPVGGRDVIRKLMCICGKLPFDLIIHELPVNEKSVIKAEKIDPMFTISVLPLKHSMPCLGYSFLLDKKAVFLPDKAKELDIPLKYWRVLHSGESVTTEDGKTFTPDMVTGDKRASVKITYVTDTLPIREIADFAKNSDLFICEGMYGDLEMKESMNQKRHMLMQDACTLAKSAEAKRLWLTHYSPAEKRPERFEKRLKKIFESITVSSDGEKISL